MSKDIISDRRHALEDKFFKDLEAKNISRLRAELAAKSSREELSKASGIDSEELLDALVALDVGASDLSALSLIPLVEVAWADGKMSPSEKSAILEAASGQGIEDDSHAHELLEAWLDHNPGEELYKAWTEYVESITAALDDSQRVLLHETIVGLTHDVASAAGGILGIGAISSEEKAVLMRIGAVLRGE